LSQKTTHTLKPSANTKNIYRLARSEFVRAPDWRLGQGLIGAGLDYAFDAGIFEHGQAVLEYGQGRIVAHNDCLVDVESQFVRVAHYRPSLQKKGAASRERRETGPPQMQSKLPLRQLYGRMQISVGQIDRKKTHLQRIFFRREWNLQPLRASNQFEYW
jgi:hypothetical protein